MKPHPRIRKTVKWAASAVAVLLTVAWLLSGWYRLIIVGSNWSTGFHHGFFGFASGPTPRAVTPISFYRESSLPIWDLKCTWQSASSGIWIACSVWIVALAFIAVAFVLWLPDLRARLNQALIRARAGMCPSCNYDLRGLAPGAKCPECGGAEAK
jgi:hypothetical protein